MTVPAASELKELLFVEDNHGDIELLRYAFGAANFSPVIQVAKSVEEGLNFLYRRNGCENAVKPELILLDLGLPDGDGFSILETIRKDENLKGIKVVVYTTQNPHGLKEKVQSKDAVLCTKPKNLEEFVALARYLSGFWGS